MKLETERLFLKLLNLSDVNKFIQLCNLPGTTEFTLGSYNEMNYEKASNWIEAENVRFKRCGLGKLGVFLKENSELIGVAGIFNSPHRLGDSAEVNYRFPRKYRGKGYAAEAVKALLNYGYKKVGLPEIHATVDIDNVSSKKLLNKFNFSYVGEIIDRGITVEHWKSKQP